MTRTILAGLIIGQLIHACQWSLWAAVATKLGL